MIAISGHTQLINLKHDFPNQWNQFLNQEISEGHPRIKLNYELTEKHYPFWSKSRLEKNTIKIKKVEVFAIGDSNSITIYDSLSSGNSFELHKQDKLLSGGWENILLPNPLGEVALYFENNNIEDLWFAIAWGVEIK